MNYLITADLHCDSAPEHAYRFGVFDFLRQVIDEYHVEAVFILGDLTEAKDRHPARLVTQVVEGLRSLLPLPYGVTVVMGNHDYLNREYPFFNFINAIDGLKFVTEPCWGLPEEHGRIALLPNCADPVREWKKLPYLKDAGTILMHQPVIGARASNGFALQEGLKPRYFEKFSARVISGDIHTPQRVGKVLYVGSPHSVHYGEHHEPRVFVMEGDKLTAVRNLMAPTNWSIAVEPGVKLAKLKCRFKSGDRIKIQLEMDSTALYKWNEYRADLDVQCQQLELQVKEFTVHARTSKDLSVEAPVRAKAERQSTPGIFKEYCERNKISGVTRETGVGILKWYLGR